MDCIFCKIIDGEIPCNKIYEDKNFLVILDAFPANIGHCLVIPKEHNKDIFDIDFDALSKAHILAKKTALAIKDTLNVENINIIQNNGELAGQSVAHFHIHVVPRFTNDGVTIKSEVINIDDKKLMQIKEKLSLSINNN